MTTDSTHLAHPIDALYLVHKALRTEAERAEQAVTHLEVGSSFKAFQPVSTAGRWRSAPTWRRKTER